MLALSFVISQKMTPKKTFWIFHLLKIKMYLFGEEKITPDQSEHQREGPRFREMGAENSNSFVVDVFLWNTGVIYTSDMLGLTGLLCKWPRIKN